MLISNWLIKHYKNNLKIITDLFCIKIYFIYICIINLKIKFMNIVLICVIAIALSVSGIIGFIWSINQSNDEKNEKY